ncbi:protein UL27 [Saimiriine betaherpesvirus 4]|uniref:Protein UL27 n=1 Tax=Saimiriine betaherpesvirus 4 TaxID=1535247 RepID=G8XSU1_9BETA|nr:protein UL27 [Saimiriine betaherpesvirus 4]AEV80888.1 protein UL27 [Saimiriine betaherpesvirus 4]
MDEALFQDPLVLYRYVRDCEDTDGFVEEFVSTYLVPVTNKEQALKAGFFVVRLYEGIVPSFRDGSLVTSTVRHTIITLRRSVLKNSKYTTAHGKYEIRGLKLEWDLAVWAVLRSVSLASISNPLLNKNIRTFRYFLQQAQFLPHTSRFARTACISMATAQYLMCTLINYKECGSLTHYMRQLCSMTGEIYDRLAGTLPLFDDPETKNVIRKFFIDDLCQEAGLDYRVLRNAVFFKTEFQQACERALAALYAHLCICGDCNETVEPNVPCRLESVPLVLANYRDLGSFRLPALRHLTQSEQRRVRHAVSCDLAFALWNQTTSEPRYLLPSGLSCGEVRRNYVMYLASNIVFNLKLIRMLHRVIQREFMDGVRFLSSDRDLLVGMLRQRYVMHEKALVKNPRHQKVASECLQQIVELRDLDFSNTGKRSFVESVCDLQDVLKRVPDYQISLREKQQMFLLHHLRLRRFYTESSSETKLGENLIWYYLKRGNEVSGRDMLLRLNTRLTEDELCNETNRCRRQSWLHLPITPVPVKCKITLKKYHNIYIRRFKDGEVGGSL